MAKPDAGSAGAGGAGSGGAGSGAARPVRLQAQDSEDLKILSALLQDAAVRVGDMAWLQQSRRFAFGGSRFRWEAAAPGGRPDRIGFGAHIDHVQAVAQRGIAQDRADDVLLLLAVTATVDEAGAAEFSLIFAGGGAINLRVECIDMCLADLGEPYATRLKPAHDLGPDPAAGES